MDDYHCIHGLGVTSPDRETKRMLAEVIEVYTMPKCTDTGFEPVLNWWKQGLIMLPIKVRRL